METRRIVAGNIMAVCFLLILTACESPTSPSPPPPPPPPVPCSSPGVMCIKTRSISPPSGTVIEDIDDQNIRVDFVYNLTGSYSDQVWASTYLSEDCVNVLSLSRTTATVIYHARGDVDSYPQMARNAGIAETQCIVNRLELVDAQTWQVLSVLSEEIVPWVYFFPNN